MTPPIRPQGRPPYEDLERYVAGPEPVRRRRRDDDRAELAILAIVSAALIVLIVVAIVVLSAIRAASRPAASPHDPAARGTDMAGLARVSPPTARDTSGAPLTGTPRSVPVRGVPLTDTVLGTVLTSGTATWYCGGGSACTRGYGPSDLIAAIDPSLGIARGTRLVVRHGGHAVTVRVVDVCYCVGRRVIDLSRLAFSVLADPSRGVIAVTLERAGRVPTALPATDTAR